MCDGLVGRDTTLHRSSSYVLLHASVARGSMRTNQTCKSYTTCQRRHSDRRFRPCLLYSRTPSCVPSSNSLACYASMHVMPCMGLLWLAIAAAAKAYCYLATTITTTTATLCTPLASLNFWHLHSSCMCAALCLHARTCTRDSNYVKAAAALGGLRSLP